ncbi:thiamine phosphate synthase [Vagococcus vulneris]|uniref:Thiamine-phosphate synthase n=1 Tax=Vagococcus vulneris TaxID=1977869 RepID=A0A429ZZ33_9ENTE|nr:thiamine phosphate synthase [Vagococcus vulneris]RST99268.1 thiamine-phosphate diphosphorylase [Vagococcus vulneris]
MEELLPLYLVTNRYDFSDDIFLNIIREACQSGVSMVQLREKKATTRRFYELASTVKKITDDYSIPLIINDRIDICLAVDAAGVHIGDDELPVDVTRQLIGPDKWLGVSSKTVAASLAAEKNGADYLGVGAIFPTSTKKNAEEVSIDTLKQITRETTIPVVAIGGINTTNLSILADSGISGISLVSDIMLAESVKQKTKMLRGVINRDILKKGIADHDDK